MYAIKTVRLKWLENTRFYFKSHIFRYYAYYTDILLTLFGIYFPPLIVLGYT